jgi:tetratricopeptide (TPR) repeat protein
MGKFIFKYICLTATVLLLAAAALVPQAVSAQSEYGGVENVFSYGTGLRALGMGGAFTAVTEDPYLGYWNPGAMAYNQYREVAVSGSRLIADSYYFSGFYTNPTLRLGTLSVGAMGIFTDGIESYDENASPITGASTSYLQYQFLLSYGYGFKFGLGVGASAKIDQMRITDYKGTGASFDIGVYYAPPKLSWIAFGAVVQDVYGTGIKLLDEFEQNTRIFKFGLATNFDLGAKRSTSLLLTFDTRFFSDNYNPSSGGIIYDFSFGSEVTIADLVALRAGINNLSPGSIQLPAGLAFGIGVRQWGVGIDWSVNFVDSDVQNTIDMLLRLGISYRFGKSMEERRIEEAERIQQQIADGIKEATAKFDEERATLERQQAAEKQRIEEEYEQRRQDLIAQIETSDLTIQEKEQALQELALERDAALAAATTSFAQERAQLEAQLEQQRLAYEQQLRDLAARYEGEQQAVSELEALKSRLYADGMQAFSEGRFEDAEQAFREVAALDPAYLRVDEYLQRSIAEQQEVTTYSPEIMEIYYEGLNYFVNKDYQQAIDVWRRILDIDRYNKLALRNIQEAERRLRKIEELGINE